MPASSETPPVSPPLDTPPWPRWAHAGLAASLTITGALGLLLGLGSTPALVAGAAWGLALIAWWRTGVGDPRAHVGRGIALTVALLVVTTELYLLDAADGAGVLPARGLLIAAYSIVSVAVFGVRIAWSRQPLGAFTLWALACTAMVVGVALPVGAAATGDGGYPTGLVTGLGWALLGFITARGLVRDARVDAGQER